MRYYIVKHPFTYHSSTRLNLLIFIHKRIVVFRQVWCIAVYFTTTVFATGVELDYDFGKRE